MGWNEADAGARPPTSPRGAYPILSLSLSSSLRILSDRHSPFPQFLPCTIHVAGLRLVQLAHILADPEQAFPLIDGLCGHIGPFGSL